MSARETATKKRILLVDDNLDFSEETGLILEKDFEVRTCRRAEEGIEIHREGWPDLILLDIELPGMDGIAALGEIRRQDTTTPVIMVTVHEDISGVVEAMRKGAYHYVSKAQGPDILLETIHGALRHSELERSYEYFGGRLEESRGGGSLVLGPGAASRRLLTELEHAARADVSVLITGETGTGKELVAKEIHARSVRSSKPFVPVDIASLPETLVESSLFGHEKGAFTGATTRRRGAFEAAEGGTVFLDEVAEIPLSIQVRLLRVLQEKSFRRLGGFGAPETKANVRILASTNKELQTMAARREFRSDLFYRLNVMRIEVPPLRERPEDLPVLARHFIEKHHVATGSLVTDISEELIRDYQRRDWPGNVRELENTIVAGMVRAQGSILGPVPDGARAGGPGSRPVPPYPVARERALEDFKRAYLERVLEMAGGVVNQAARLAGLSQSSFRKMMKDVGLSAGD